MQTRLPWNAIAIWLVVSVIGVLSCSVGFSAVHAPGEYLPVGNDAFYHARRILDTVRDPSSFYEFDTRIHVPEGSLLTWPWGYDYALAWIVRAGMAVGLSSDPMAVLDWIPVAALPLSLALLLFIGRFLGLSNWMLTLAGLCMALAPTTHLIHGVGQIDHHYAEMMFLLASLAAGLVWLRNPESRRAAVLLALALGAAPAIHNGLFVLQVPILVALLVPWLQGKSTPRPASLVFAATLLATTLAILIPSQPFREGRFEFITLSWFHLYVAACTAIVVVLLSWLAPSRKGIAAVLAAAAALLVPMLGQLSLAGTFLTGADSYLQRVGEMYTPVRMVRQYGLPAVTRWYSYLILLAPFTVLLCAAKCWFERSSGRVLFWITAVIGLGLLSLQLRMHYFGDFALALPWLVLVQELVDKRPLMRRKALLALSLAVLLLYAPVLRYAILVPQPLGGDAGFQAIYKMLGTLRSACAKRPGIVLTDPNAGHYIRYYTECSVISNMFLLTPQHAAKHAETERLFRLGAADLLHEPLPIAYVLVRPLDVRRPSGGKLTYEFFYEGFPRLPAELLLRPVAELPAEYRLLQEIKVEGPEGAAYARLFEIARERPATSSVTSSAASPIAGGN